MWDRDVHETSKSLNENEAKKNQLACIDIKEAGGGGEEALK